MTVRRRLRLIVRAVAVAATVGAGTCNVAGAVPAAHVRRLITLAPVLTEDVFTVGAGKTLVGVDAYSNRPAAAKRIVRVGAFREVNVERIVALHPDLVIGVSAQAPELLDVARAGIATKTIDVDSLADDFRAIETIGDLVGEEPRAVATVATLRKRLAAAQRLASHYRSLRAVVIFETDPTIYVAGGPSYIGGLLHVANLTNIAGTLHEAWPQYSAETLLADQPDVIIISSDLTFPAGSPWDRLSALRNGRVVRINADLLSRPGPQVADLVDELIAKLARMRPLRQRAAGKS